MKAPDVATAAGLFLMTVLTVACVIETALFLWGKLWSV